MHTHRAQIVTRLRLQKCHALSNNADCCDGNDSMLKCYSMRFWRDGDQSPDLPQINPKKPLKEPVFNSVKFKAGLTAAAHTPQQRAHK